MRTTVNSCCHSGHKTSVHCRSPVCQPTQVLAIYIGHTTSRRSQEPDTLSDLACDLSVGSGAHSMCKHML